MTSTSPSSKPSSRKVVLAIKLSVSLALVVAILFVVPWRDLVERARQLDPRLWLGVWAAFLLGHVTGAFKWRLNVNIARARLGPLDAVQCYFAGLFANLCLPSIVGGDALKAILAGQVTGRYEAAVFGGLAERLIDTTALLVLIVVGALLSHQGVDGWAQNTMLVGGLVGAAGFVLFLPLVLRMKLARLPGKLRRPAGRAMVAMRRLRRRPQLALGVFALSIAIQSWFVLLNYWLGLGIGIDIGLSFWFLAIPLAKAITLAPISVGGFGLREVTLAGILSIAGVAESQGVLVSILWQTVVVATGLLGGLVWFLLGLRPSARTGAGHGSLLDARHA